MPNKEYLKTSEVNIEVDAWQFTKLPERSKADYDENQIIRHEGCRDSSSDSSESYTKRRRAVILKRAEQNERHAQRIERHVQRVEERGEREERMLQLCDRNHLPRPPMPAKDSRKDEVAYKGDYYYRRSYAERFPETGAGSSTDQRRGRRNFRRIYPNPPVSPGGIKRAARWVEENAPHKLQILIEFRKLFEWKDGERFLYAEHILKNLSLKPRYYCPILRSKANGELIYEHVKEYNSKWLPRTKKGVEKEPSEYFSINPVEIWQEDAWTFVRRMVGDALAQKFFYEFMTRTWILIDVDKGTELQNYQDALIDNVFGHRSIDYFVKNQKTDTVVNTYDGRFTGDLAYEELAHFGRQICVLGPIAGVFGRQLEQWLISPDRKLNEVYIPVAVIQRSIEEAPCALKRSWLYNAPKQAVWSGRDEGDWDDDYPDYNTTRRTTCEDATAKSWPGPL